MTDIRRTFDPGLAKAFGEQRISDLRKRIEDQGKPVLLKPTGAGQDLFVAEGGALFLGALTPDMPRPSWRAFLQHVDALDGCGPAPIHWLMEKLSPASLDERVDDARWGAVFRAAYDPMAAAYHLLRRLDTGPGTAEARPENGRLDLLAGFAYSGEYDLWAEASDDLSVSLLQARLIQLGQPVRIVMEARTIVRAEADIDADETVGRAAAASQGPVSLIARA